MSMTVSSPSLVVRTDVLKPIGSITFRNRNLYIKRDNHGKFWVWINGKSTQRRLTAEEIVRYLLNAMEGR